MVVKEWRGDLPVEYVNRREVSDILGGQGPGVLQNVLMLLQNRLRAEKWPLIQVIVSPEVDPDVPDWEGLSLKLIFDCPFDQADQALQHLYPELDAFTRTLESKDATFFTKVFSIDVDTTGL